MVAVRLFFDLIGKTFILSAYLCKDGNIEFEYRIIFRVGCPSAAFDMNKAFIDLELLGPEKENLSDLVRFNLAKLPNRICGEMHLLLGRMNEIPTIYGIRARHSDQVSGSQLCLATR